MATPHYFLVFLFTSTCILLPELGNAFEMNVAPSWYTDRHQGGIAISCTAKDAQARSVTSVDIWKGNHLFARFKNEKMTRFVGGKFSPSYSMTYAKGTVLRETRDAIYIKSPVQSDTGIYHCVFHYNNTDGGQEKKNVQSYVVVADTTTNDLENNVNKLKAKEEQIEKELSEYKESDRNETVFTATGGATGIPIQQNQTIIFSTVTVNTGKGYDVTTGIFTAPVSGIYVLQLSLELNCLQCEARVQLKTDKQDLHFMYLGHYFITKTEEFTIPVYLEDGEKVWVYTVTTLQDDLFLTPTSSFTGYLLQSLG